MGPQQSLRAKLVGELDGSELGSDGDFRGSSREHTPGFPAPQLVLSRSKHPGFYMGERFVSRRRAMRGLGSGGSDPRLVGEGVPHDGGGFRRD